MIAETPKKRQRRKSAARLWAESIDGSKEDWNVPGKASDYIVPVEELLPGTRVILLCRVSGRLQGESGNTDDQESSLRKIATENGLVVVEAWPRIQQGHGEAWLDQLTSIANSARKHDAVILAETTNRFIRHPGFEAKDKDKKKLQARKVDLEKLKEATNGITLATVENPDATPGEEIGRHASRGMREKGKLGGRPTKPGYKKRRRERKRATVIRLHQQGVIHAEIARKTGIHRNTVDRWVDNWIKKNG